MTLDGGDGADIIVLADAFGAPGREHQGEAGLVLISRLAARAASARFVLAGASHAWLVEKAVTELGLPVDARRRDRALGDRRRGCARSSASRPAPRRSTCKSPSPVCRRPPRDRAGNRRPLPAPRWSTRSIVRRARPHRAATAASLAAGAVCPCRRRVCRDRSPGAGLASSLLRLARARRPSSRADCDRLVRSRRRRACGAAGLSAHERLALDNVRLR